jgi:hypothetical protein
MTKDEFLYTMQAYADSAWDADIKWTRGLAKQFEPFDKFVASIFAEQANALERLAKYARERTDVRR